jgi:type I restriction enzyme M protein
MLWVAPLEKDAATETLEKRLWSAADQFRDNSGLKAQESAPDLGLIFLCFAEVCFTAQQSKLEKASALSRHDSRQAQIQNLRRTRDLLLPRLLSGQVELKTN